MKILRECVPESIYRRRVECLKFRRRVVNRDNELAVLYEHQLRVLTI